MYPSTNPIQFRPPRQKLKIHTKPPPLPSPLPPIPAELPPLQHIQNLPPHPYRHAQNLRKKMHLGELVAHLRICTQIHQLDLRELLCESRAILHECAEVRAGRVAGSGGCKVRREVAAEMCDFEVAVVEGGEE